MAIRSRIGARTQASGEVKEALEGQDGLAVTRCYAALLFQLSEHALDAVAIPVATIVGMGRDFRFARGGMMGNMPRMCRLSRNLSPS